MINIARNDGTIFILHNNCVDLTENEVKRAFKNGQQGKLIARALRLIACDHDPDDYHIYRDGFNLCIASRSLELEEYKNVF